MGTETAIFAGPWGGSGGNHFDDGSYNGVAEIVLTHGEVIDSIQILYVSDGNTAWSAKHGGEGGGLSQVNLRPNEYLTGISGHYGTTSEIRQTVIRSLTFTSNMATYGPFGSQNGTPFSLPMRRGKIVAFAGNAGPYLDNIGVYIRQS